MRALSLNERSDAPLPQVVGQAAHAVLKELNDHQLSFEELTKDPELDHLFRCATEVKGHLAKVATYLQERVVRPWEMAGEALLAKGDRQPLSELGPFVSFAKDSDAISYRKSRCL